MDNLATHKAQLTAAISRAMRRVRETRGAERAKWMRAAHLLIEREAHIMRLQRRAEQNVFVKRQSMLGTSIMRVPCDNPQ